MGKLSIVSTPIGNLEDITIRAIKILFSSDAILCEDSRRSGLLIQELVSKYHELFDFNPDWKPTFIPYYDEIEAKILPEIVSQLLEGKELALISDAGTPLISDPGFRLVHECVKRSIPVESIPGPSAVLAALTSSGLPVDTFMFLGYFPEKQVQRIKLLQNISHTHEYINNSYIFYCAPHKLLTTLEDLKSVFGDIEIVIARELTKIHEEIWKGTITKAQYNFSNPKGEIVLLFRLP